MLDYAYFLNSYPKNAEQMMADFTLLSYSEIEKIKDKWNDFSGKDAKYWATVFRDWNKIFKQKEGAVFNESNYSGITK